MSIHVSMSPFAKASAFSFNTLSGLIMLYLNIKEMNSASIRPNNSCGNYCCLIFCLDIPQAGLWYAYEKRAYYCALIIHNRVKCRNISLAQDIPFSAQGHA